jgi:diguanylate cyclase (GGDEF)-like protein
VDAAGMVLSGHPQPGAWAGRDVADYPLMREVRARGQGTVTSEGFDDVRRIWGFRPIADGAGHLLVGIDEREVFAGVQREMTWAYVQLALIVILVLLGAWSFGEHTILSPIRALARAAEQIGRGELTVRTTGKDWAPEFSPLTRSLDSMAARLAAREHSLRRESDRFKELATLDSLTGLSNRRALDAHLADEWQRAAGKQAPIALLMIDVDHFKRYNDRYGHLEGDTCLRAISRILAEAAVWGACGARYGGEEFALLIPDADSARASSLAEHVRRAVEALAIAHADAPSGIVTVSIGFGSLVPAAGTPASTLVEAADAGLYAAKRRGRNTVVEHATFDLAEAS